MLYMTVWKLFPLKLTDVKIHTRQLDLFPFLSTTMGLLNFI